MVLRRWEPFEEMRQMGRAMDRMLGEGFFHPLRLWRQWEEAWVPLDVYQTREAVEVKAPLPGIKPEDVEITIEGNTLTIKGESKEEKERKEESYLLRERRYGSFHRMVTLPSGLDTDKAEATFEHGVLTLTIPRVEEAKPKSIKVKARTTVEGKKK